MANPVKEKLLRGEPVFGPSFGFACATLVEISGLLGFDFAYLDAEHGTLSPREVEDMVRAADVRRLPTISRVGTHDPQVMLRYLDTGIAGIQLPHMRSREDVEHAVRAVRFHPYGERGLAGGRWANYGFGETLPRAVQRANEDVLLIAQIEDLDAVERLDEITSVPGIDVWFVGPSDLSQAVGVPGQQDHPAAQEIVASTITRLRQMGKIVGSAAAQPDVANRYLALGVQYLQINVPRLFVAGAQAFQRGIQLPAKEPVTPPAR
jgi:4-hydroxy-2-oxoheptanedioate aldolase